jgi:hypothetical protein
VGAAGIGIDTMKKKQGTIILGFTVLLIAVIFTLAGYDTNRWKKHWNQW